MTYTAVRSAVTLLELLAAVVLLAVIVGIATVGGSGVVDDVRVNAAASQIGSLYRIAVSEATRSGRPRIMQCDPYGCILKKPVHQRGRWVWLATPRLDVIPKVTITGVFRMDVNGTPGPSGPPWEVAISPGTVMVRHEVMFQCGSSSTARRALDGSAHMPALNVVWTDNDGS